MQTIRAATLWLGLLACVSGVLWAQAEPHVFKPSEVEVRLRDGTIVRGELRGLDALALKTPYGTLNFPIATLVLIQPGVRTAAQDAETIAATIKDLDSDDFGRRSEAQRKLELFGVKAAEQLRLARQTASAEVRARLDAVLKKTAALQAKVRSEDLVRADDFEATGVMRDKTIKLAHRLGELEVDCADIESIRWMGKGDIKRLELEPDSALTEWVDTGLDCSAGEQVLMLSGGMIYLFQSTNVNPLGSSNWGRSGQFQTGAVIGKIGAEGKPFLIGTRKTLSPPMRGRLYVKIHSTEEVLRNNEGRQSTGKYKLSIATGARLDDLKNEDLGSGEMIPE